ncbi:MAG: HEAT repeat domain-containing protein [Planctomycetes bacterium]|nr:HEAT repeat domain-containing protein [Planctomycetota bacterium]
MRIASVIVAAAAFVGALVAAPAASPDDGEDGKSSDDLFTYRRTASSIAGGKVTGWSAWWYANRTNLLQPEYRAPATSGALPREMNVAARDLARAALLEALQQDHWLIASEAALALGRLGDARDISTLSRIVLDPGLGDTRRKHRMAALGLGMLPLGSPAQAAEARKALVEALTGAVGQHDRFSYFWANCAYALAMRGDSAAVPALVDLRSKGLAGANVRSSLHADVLGPMCYAFGALAGRVALPEIEEQIRATRVANAGSKDPSWSACHALARVGGPEAIRLARSAARDPEREPLRAVALAVLGTLAGPDDDESAAILRAALASDESLLARGMAAVALGRTGHASAGPALLAALATAPEADRPFVAIGLGFLGRAKPNPKIADALARALADEAGGAEFRSAAALACGLARVTAARDRLTVLASDKRSPACAAHAAFALGLVGTGAEGRAALHDAVARHGSFEARREAVLALGMLRDASVITQLHKIVASKSAGDVDRATAAHCLGRVGNDADIEPLLQTLRDPTSSKQLRAALVNALGWLLDRGPAAAALGRVSADTLWFMLPRGSYYNEPIHDIQHLVD